MFKDNKGFSLLEIMVAMAIIMVITIGAASLIIYGQRNNARLWDKLSLQSDGRRALSEFVNVARRAEESSTGAYPVFSAKRYEFIFYANDDQDSLRERIRFYLDQNNNIFYKGVVKPSGDPLTYDLGNETSRLLATNVINDDNGTDVFTYYDESYNGVGTPLPFVADTASSTMVHVVRVNLDFEKVTASNSTTLSLESVAHIRNLKTN